MFPTDSWVDELASADDGAPGNSLAAVPPSNALVAIVEKPVGRGKGKARATDGSDDEVRIGLVSVIPATGDCTWDEFTGESAFQGNPLIYECLTFSSPSDGPARTELEVSARLQLEESPRKADTILPFSDPHYSHPAARGLTAAQQAVARIRKASRAAAIARVRRAEWTELGAFAG